MTKPLTHVLFLACCMAFLCGCPILSQNPISSPEDSVPDSRLPGKWSAVTLSITPAQSPWMHAVEIDGDSVNKYDFFSTVIGKYRFLNVQPYERRGNGHYRKKGPYYLMRYEIAADKTLTLWTIPESKAAQIVRSGKLKGQIDKNGEVYFTDSSENIRDFIQRANVKALFSQKTNHIYQKVP